MAHSKVDNTFNGAMDKLLELKSVFREGGRLEAACSEDCDLDGVRVAFEKLMGEMREAHTEATMEESITQEAGAPDYNPSRGEYASERDYGMFTDEGNAEVAEVVDDIVARHERGEFDSPERAIDAAMSDLMNLADDNDNFAEASDTDVRDQVARDLDSRIGRDSGFGETMESKMPDHPDVDGDGDTEEDITKAEKDKKEKTNESVVRMKHLAGLNQ